jgi:hypothetical protein
MIFRMLSYDGLEVAIIFLLYNLDFFKCLASSVGWLLAGVYNSFAMVMEWYLYSLLNAMGMRSSNNGTD